MPRTERSVSTDELVVLRVAYSVVGTIEPWIYPYELLEQLRGILPDIQVIYDSGQIQKILKRLEASGYLESEKRLVPGCERRTRIYYWITDSGKEAYIQRMRQQLGLKEEERPRLEELLKFVTI